MDAVVKFEKKPTRRQLLKVIGRLQTLIGQAHGGYLNDRAVCRATAVEEPLNEAFELCLEARRFDPAD